MFVRLEDEMQNRGNFLPGPGRGRIEQIRGEGDEDPKRLLDDARQNIALLAEPNNPAGAGSVSAKPTRTENRL